MSLPSRLTIAGTALAVESHNLALSVQVSRHPSGRRALSISATGQRAPDLAAVDWTLPVAIAWTDLANAGEATSLTVLAGAGVQRTDDLDGITCAWTLAGVEAGSNAGLVAIGGTAYWAAVSRTPIGGTIQRKTNGAGTLLRAWGRCRVTIRGEGLTAPDAAGVVTVASSIYTGSLLVSGVAAALDPATGLVTWTIDGEQP